MNKKNLMGLLSVVTIPLLAACQGGETPSAASKNSQTVTTQSSAKTFGGSNNIKRGSERTDEDL